MERQEYASENRYGRNRATAVEELSKWHRVLVNVETSDAHFAQTPLYFTSIAGISHHWATAGATSIYDATPTGFRIYVRWAEGDPLTVDDAVAHGWYINWMAIETT